MRFHKRYPLLQLWLDSSGTRDAISAASLSVIRFESATSRGVSGAAFLDLVFSRGQTIAVLPYLEVDTVMLLERGRTPLIWPDAAGALGHSVLDELERSILPWLESRTLARQMNEELVHYVSGAIGKEHFEAARSARFLGASPYAECMAAFAPYVYALRFSEREKTAVVADPYGASGAALLAARGLEVKADLGDGSGNELAASWFGRTIFDGVRGVRSECALTIHTADAALPAGEMDIALDHYGVDAREIHVASPVPSDVMISFDPDDAPPVRSFGVSLRHHVPLRDVSKIIDTPVSGGSSGTVLMLLRDGFATADDSDTDEAYALTKRLHAEGFTVNISSPASLAPDTNADLVHVFGLQALDQSANYLRQYRSRNIPIVATPSIPRFAHEEVWGPQILRALFTRSADEAVLQERLELMELRRLNTETAVQAYESAAVCTNVDVAIAGTAAEEADLRERYAFRGEIVRSTPYLCGIDAEAAAVGTLTGTLPFAFVHAPLEWRMNLALVVRAATQLNIPVVVAGRTVDVDAMQTARALAPNLLVHLPEATPSEVAALYRAARAYVDLSWGTRGNYRVARALASGCAVIAPKASYARETWPGAILEADPASETSIAQALQNAWNRPSGGHWVPNAGEAFSAVIFAYAKAQQTCISA